MTAKPGILSRIRKTAPASADRKPPLKLPDGEWIELRYPGRIPPLQPRELKLWQKLFLTAIRIGAGDTYDYTCFLVTARLGKVMPLHTLFFTQLLQHGRIPQADNECIVTRVAWRMGCQYEYAHHTRMALELGVPQAEVESLTNEHDPSWSPRIRTLMTATDELLNTRNLTPETYGQLRRELDENQILEFTTLVGHYVMASMMLSVAGVEIEPAFALT